MLDCYLFFVPSHTDYGNLVPKLITTADNCEIRPCPHLICQYHNIWMWVFEADARKRGKALASLSDDAIIQLVEDMPYSCEIDLIKAHPEGVTLQALADQLNCTRERIRQIQVAAIKKLKLRTNLKQYSAYKEHRQDTYGLSSADPYAESLPNLKNIADTRHWLTEKLKRRKSSWQVLHGNGSKPGVGE